MNQQLTDFTIILDRSGSMQSIQADMEGALAALIAEQTALPGELRVSLVRFDDLVEPVFTALPAAEVRRIKIRPRGCTALLDAVGDTIDTTGQRLAAIPGPDRPGTVLIAIVTDGLENASQRFRWNEVHQRITHQSTAYGWQFVFLGTNIDAIATAGRIGIAHGDAMTFANDTQGTQDAVQATSAGIRRKREHVAFSLASAGTPVPAFTDKDRAAQRR